MSDKSIDFKTPDRSADQPVLADAELPLTTYTRAAICYN